MTKKEITRSVIECDVCNGEILYELYYDVIELNKHDWDLCKYCVNNVTVVLTFLTIVVGLPIEYKMKQLVD
jgi:hypothetical protein